MKNEIIKFNSDNAVDIKKIAWESLSIESQKAYQFDFNSFFSFIEKEPSVITSNDILLYIKHLEEKGLKNSTINRKISSLSKMFHILQLAKEIEKNPVQVLKEFKNILHKTSKEIKVSLTIDDIKKVTKIHDFSSDQEKRMSVIIRFLAMTGLRISEMINIKHRDIEQYDKKNYKIRIVGKGKKERFVFLPVDVHAEIIRLYPVNDRIDCLFYSLRFHKFHRGQLWQQIHQEFEKKLNVSVHPHTLRHAFITHKISVEKQDIRAVSRYVGHQDVTTTLNMYVDSSLDVDSAGIKI